MANSNIGMVLCPFTGTKAAVRRDKKGKLYMISIVGMIRPNLAPGQRYLQENATIWGQDGTPPEDCPEWIAKGESWPRDDDPADAPAPSTKGGSPDEPPAGGGLDDPAGEDPVQADQPADPPADPPADDQDDDDAWTPFG